MKVRIKLSAPLSAGELAKITEGTLTARADIQVNTVCTDSRLVEPGDAFIAIRGDRTDGHLFLAEAQMRGASLLVTEIEHSDALLVKHTRAALSALASVQARKLSIPIIAITGSVGKTGTKEAVAAALGARYRVHKTAENMNNELGLAYTVLGCPQSADFLVLELGTNHPGEIATLARIAPPTVAILTAIGTAHIAAFGSQEAILCEKASLIDEMAGNLVLLNGDDRLLRTLTPKKETHYIGTEGTPRLSAARISASRHGTSYTLMENGGARGRIFLRSAGRPQVYASLFAIDIALHYGIPLEVAADAIFRMAEAAGRQSIVYTDGILLIDDAYNSSPEALNEALTLLRSIAGGSRRFAVIGDMLELGAAAEGLHHAAGRHAAACATHLFAFGRYSDAIAEGAEEGGMPCECIRRFPDADACTAALLPILSDGDAVLVKASHAMGGEHICEAIRRRAIRPGGTVCKKQKG